MVQNKCRTNLWKERTIEEILKLCGFKVEYFGIFFDHERRKAQDYNIKKITTYKKWISSKI